MSIADLDPLCLISPRAAAIDDLCDSLALPDEEACVMINSEAYLDSLWWTKSIWLQQWPGVSQVTLSGIR
jgi:hypothetical protein